MDGEDLGLFGLFVLVGTMLLVSDSSEWKMPLFVVGVLCLVVGVGIGAWERNRQ